MARIKIMVSLLLLACAATVPLSQAEDLKCGDYKDKQLCLTCLQGATCVGVTDDTAAPTPTVTCTWGEVCDVLSNTATCVALDKQDTKTCSCDKSSQCDGYQPNSLLLCGNGIPFAVTDCPEKTICMDGVCVTPTTPDPAHSTEPIEELCPVDVTGWQVVKPECTTAVWCSGTKGTTIARQDCEAGQYFDIDAGNCVTAPPVPCEGNCMGPCPDKTDCSRFYICDGKGNVQDTQTCVKDDTQKTTIYFNPETHRCDGADDKVCPSTVGCTFGLTTAASTVTTPLVTTAHATTAAPTTKPATTAATTITTWSPYDTTASIDDVCDGTPATSGWQDLKPDCTSAVYCGTDKGTTIGRFECRAGHYFHTDTATCVPAPPVPCEGNCKGPCPDKTDCSRFYICDGHGLALHLLQCVKSYEFKTTDYFDAATGKCDGADDTVCPSTVGCTFGLTDEAATVTASGRVATAAAKVVPRTTVPAPKENKRQPLPMLNTKRQPKPSHMHE